jgi:hypothetical protein
MLQYNSHHYACLTCTPQVASIDSGSACHWLVSKLLSGFVVLCNLGGGTTTCAFTCTYVLASLFGGRSMQSVLVALAIIYLVTQVPAVYCWHHRLCLLPAAANDNVRSVLVAFYL